MGVETISGIGGYATGEKWQIWKPSALHPGAPILVICHGASADGWYYGADQRRSRLCWHLARTGIVVAAADLGNADPDKGPLNGTWGTPLSVQRVGELITWAGTRWGVDTGRVLLLGDSAGGFTALNYLRAHPDQIIACATRLGGVNLDAAYTGGNPLITALIDAAYDNDWENAKGAADPSLNLSDFDGLGDRLRLYYSVNDGLIPAETVTDFAEAVGCRAVPIGEVGHDAELSYPAFPDHDITRFYWWRYRAA